MTWSRTLLRSPSPLISPPRSTSELTQIDDDDQEEDPSLLWSSGEKAEPIDIGAIWEPEIKFNETPFTIARRNAASTTTNVRSATKTEKMNPKEVVPKKKEPQAQPRPVPEFFKPLKSVSQTTSSSRSLSKVTIESRKVQPQPSKKLLSSPVSTSSPRHDEPTPYASSSIGALTSEASRESFAISAASRSDETVPTSPVSIVHYRDCSSSLQSLPDATDRTESRKPFRPPRIATNDDTRKRLAPESTTSFGALPHSTSVRPEIASGTDFQSVPSPPRMASSPSPSPVPFTFFVDDSTSNMEENGNFVDSSCPAFAGTDSSSIRNSGAPSTSSPTPHDSFSTIFPSSPDLHKLSSKTTKGAASALDQSRHFAHKPNLSDSTTTSFNLNAQFSSPGGPSSMSRQSNLPSSSKSKLERFRNPRAPLPQVPPPSSSSQQEQSYDLPPHSHNRTLPDNTPKAPRQSPSNLFSLSQPYRSSSSSTTFTNYPSPSSSRKLASPSDPTSSITSTSKFTIPSLVKPRTTKSKLSFVPIESLEDFRKRKQIDVETPANTFDRGCSDEYEREGEGSMGGGNDARIEAKRFEEEREQIYLNASIRSIKPGGGRGGGVTNRDMASNKKKRMRGVEEEEEKGEESEGVKLRRLYRSLDEGNGRGVMGLTNRRGVSNREGSGRGRWKR